MHILNSTKHPQANGQVERANRTIIPLLSISASDQRHWDTKVREVERKLNTAVNKATLKTPYEALHGYMPRHHGGVLPSLSLARNEWTDPATVQEEIRENIQTAQEAMKTAYDFKHFEGPRYDVGEVVIMLKQPNPGQPSKLQLSIASSRCRL